LLLAHQESRRIDAQLKVARSAMSRQAWAEALARLEAIDRSWLPGGTGEIDYRIGLCRWNLGRRAAAAAAFRRVPTGSEYEIRARVFLAEDLLMNFQFRAAEDTLRPIPRPGQPGFRDTMKLLVRLGRMEARYDEVRAWMRAGLEDADETIAVLRQLWLLDRGGVPTQSVRENLEVALARNPDDDRVWLGLGRVATLEGRFDQAQGWLRRCWARGPEDRAVARAWLDWARATDRAGEVARLLAGPLGAELEPGERSAVRAWLAQQAGSAEDQRTALECWLESEPRNPVALEQLVTLAVEAGDVARAAELRRRKQRVDEALDQYQRRIEGRQPLTNLADCLAMAQLAEAAGRAPDARTWCRLARGLEPANPEIAALGARLDPAPAPLPCEAAGLRLGRPPRKARVPPAHPARLEFRDDAPRVGLGFRFESGETAIHQFPALMGGGVGLLDYDGDGWLDVYCVQGGPFPPPAREGTAFQARSDHGQDARAAQGDRLFRNRRDGTFEDVTDRAGIAGLSRGYGHGVAVGDYDNDGRPDLFLTRWRAYALYRNRGDGTFEDVTEPAGLGGDRDWPTSAAFADFDGDGDLDLYVCHYLRWNAEDPQICRDAQTQVYIACRPRDFPALPDHLFRNDGGRFVDVTAAANLVDSLGPGLAVVAADLDGDGKLDLFVANDQWANYLFRNRGGLQFEEVGHAAGVAANAGGGYQAGMGIACGDLDGDGRPDLAVTNYLGESTSLFHNLGAGLFHDRTAASGLAIPSRDLLGFGASFLDGDNDGHLDLVTANGHLHEVAGLPYKMPVQLLAGDGGRFHDVTATAGSALAVLRIGRGLAVGDLDNDGRLDALVVDHKGPLAYLHNRTEGSGHFVMLHLEGTRSARDAVGARVVVTAGGRSQYGWRIGGGSYQSASDGRLHFGLGPAATIESLEVSWPSGCVQQFVNLAADRGYRLREGQREPDALPGFGR
jgi:tetratricopeptide (TPR) repeat protein